MLGLDRIVKIGAMTKEEMAIEVAKANLSVFNEESRARTKGRVAASAVQEAQNQIPVHVQQLDQQAIVNEPREEAQGTNWTMWGTIIALVALGVTVAPSRMGCPTQL